LPAPEPESEAWCLAFSRDGKQLIVGYDHEKGLNLKTLQVWDLLSHQPTSFSGHSGTVLSLAVSPDGKSLGSASYDRTVRLWNLESGEEQSHFREHTDHVRAVAFHPNGQEVASAGSDRHIRRWNIRNNQPNGSWIGHDARIRALTFTPSGDRLVSAGEDKRICVWNTKDNSLMVSLDTVRDEGEVLTLATCQVENLLASGHQNGNVNIWDSARGVRLHSLHGHSDKVRCLAFTPDGKTLASGGDDKTIRLWHVQTGELLLSIPVEHAVNGLAFDHKGRRLAAALYDGAVKIWSGEE
jgi:WD40 repeat protein